MRGVSTQRPQVLESTSGIRFTHRGLHARLGHVAALTLGVCLALITSLNPVAATLDDEDMVQNQDSASVGFDPDAPTMKTQPSDASER